MRANALPANTSQAAQQVINALDNWSSASGAEVTSIMPQWKNDSTNYMTFNCHVQASGTMGTLSQFIYQIEKGPMALKLDSVQLDSHDDAGQKLTLDLQISGLALILPTTK
jgi:Tfp pilus assembly protein PilO